MSTGWSLRRYAQQTAPGDEQSRGASAFLQRNDFQGAATGLAPATSSSGRGSGARELLLSALAQKRRRPRDDLATAYLLARLHPHAAGLQGLVERKAAIADVERHVSCQRLPPGYGITERLLEFPGSLYRTRLSRRKRPCW